MSAIRKTIRYAVCILAACGLFLAALPLPYVFAADAAERWENEMVGAAFAAQAGFDGRGVRVAVIDSGAAPLGALPGLAASADYTGSGGAADSVGHGTFIAGIIAGSDAASGYRGAAPGAEIVSLKCFSSDNAGVPAAAAAIRDAVDVYGCRVINLSFGQKTDDDELRQAVEHALGKGAVIFAAAGNGGSEDLYYPAAYEGVIAVNSVDRVGAPARDAQKNGSVDIETVECVNELDVVLNVAIEDNILKSRAASCLIELLHSEDVLVDSLCNVVVLIIIIGRDRYISCKCHLSVLEECQTEEILIDLNNQERHLFKVGLVSKYDT